MIDLRKRVLRDLILTVNIHHRLHDLSTSAYRNALRFNFRSVSHQVHPLFVTFTRKEHSNIDNVSWKSLAKVKATGELIAGQDPRTGGNSIYWSCSSHNSLRCSTKNDSSQKSYIVDWLIAKVFLEIRRPPNISSMSLIFRPLRSETCTRTDAKNLEYAGSILFRPPWKTKNACPRSRSTSWCEDDIATTLPVHTAPNLTLAREVRTYVSIKAVAVKVK